MSAEPDGSIPSRLFEPVLPGLLPAVLRRALDAATYGITVTEAAGDRSLIYANDAFFAMTGYRHDDGYDLHGSFLDGAATDAAVARELSDALSEGREISRVVLSYRQDGSTFFNEMHLEPVRAGDGREVTHFVGTHTDVTARVQAAGGHPHCG